MSKLIRNQKVAYDDSLEKHMEIKASPSRVWRALTEYREFGEWFKVSPEGPFQPGEIVRGMITRPGFEHVVWQATVVSMEPEHRFSFNWHPYAVDPDVDYSNELPTLVEFTLEPIEHGTLLRVTESGFDNIPGGRRPQTLRMNTHGREIQVENIKRHVD